MVFSPYFYINKERLGAEAGRSESIKEQRETTSVGNGRNVGIEHFQRGGDGKTKQTRKKTRDKSL